MPCPCLDKGGLGGDGIRAQRVYVAASSVSGGPGMSFKTSCDFGQGVPWGQNPDGAPYAPGTTVVPLNNDLTSSAALQVGANTNLQWTAGSGQLVVLSLQPRLPPLDVPQGALFADVSAPTYIGPIAAGIGAATIGVPSNPSWIGTSMVVQVFDPITGLTRPVFDVVRP
jgi:hypothetical protein